MRGLNASIWILFAWAVLWSVPSTAQLADSPWPAFRCNYAHTGRSTLEGPLVAADAWRVDLGGNGGCSPAVGHSAVYTAAGGSLVAVGMDGSVLWTYNYGLTGRSSPAVAADGTIYIATSDARLHAVRPDGTLKWKKNLSGPADSSPTIGPDGTVYIGTNGSRLEAYRGDGTFKFSYVAGGAVTSSAAIGPDGSICFGCDDGSLYVLNPNGTFKWKFNTTPAGAIKGSPCIGPDGSIYFGSLNGFFYSVWPTGGLRWRIAAGPIASSPAMAADGSIYFGSRDYRLYCATPLGAVKWTYATGGYVDSSPAVDAIGKVYFGSNDGFIYALNPDGSLLWSYSIGAAVTSSPAIGQMQLLYVMNYDGYLCALGRDKTPPTEPVVIDDGIYTTSLSELHATWSSTDPESDIVLYEYAIGTLPGAQDVLPFTSAGTEQEITCTGLQLVNGVRYYISVRATNEAGLTSNVGSSDGIITDATAPAAPTVIDDGQFTTSLNTLHASWTTDDAESGVAGYEYAIGSEPGAEDIVPYTAVGLTQEITRSDLSLQNGSVYYFSIRAVNGAGLVSDPGSSDGILVDSTPPAVPVVIDDGDFTGSANSLHFVYSSGDAESGIDYYEYSIGSSKGLADIVEWRNAGQEREQTVTGLTLAHAQVYYVNVRAYNRAGLVSTGSSNGIIVDLTPPVVSGVDVGASLSEMHVVVTASDAESDIAAYRYVVLTSPQLPPSPKWQASPVEQQIVIPGPFDAASTYYVAVQAQNRVGQWSETAISSPIVLDTTPPSVPVVVDDGDYQQNSTALNASWTSQDPESGVSNYAYCVGTQPGLADIVDWTDTTSSSVSLSNLSIPNGSTCYFTVRAQNRAGLVSEPGHSDGITIDTTAPPAPVVIDDGEFTSMSGVLHAAINASDPESGIAEYLYCIGTAPGADNIRGWTSAADNGYVIAENLSLELGVTYYISAKVRNRAGAWSGVGTSDGIVYRLGNPAWPKFRGSLSNCGRSNVRGPALGHVLWSIQTDGYIESSAAIGEDGTVYIGSGDGKLYAISSAGTIRWTYQTDGNIDSSPAIGPEGKIYVGSYDGYLYCILPTGQLNWKFKAGDMIWSSPAIGSDGWVYFGCQNGNLYALDSTGALRWEYHTGGAIWSSPALASDGTVYFTSGDGKLYSVSKNGVLKWTYATGSAADSSPAIGDDGAIYFGSGDGHLYAVNSDGTLRWKRIMGNLVDSSPAVGADGTIYVGVGGVGSTGSFRAFSPSGESLWTLQLPGGVRSSPAIDSEGRIYFGCSSGIAYCVSPSGNIEWTFDTKQSIISSPALGPSGSVVIGSDDGCIYCFKDFAGQDSTPPSTPVVSLERTIVSATTGLLCSWQSSDPESGIESYSYAVGTSPGAEDVIGWTNVGHLTTLHRTDLRFEPGRAYYVSVRARNYAALTSEVGTSEAFRYVSDGSGTIGAAKKMATGSHVALTGKIVSAVFDDCFFIQEPDRSAGIRCMGSIPAGVGMGDMVDVSATLSAENGEKILSSVAIENAGQSANININPMLLNTRALFGAGLDARGLLVRLAGRVVRTGPGYFILYDGQNIFSSRQAVGIEVRTTGSIPDEGTNVVVTGVGCMELVYNLPMVVIRAVSDPEIVSPLSQ